MVVKMHVWQMRVEVEERSGKQLSERMQFKIQHLYNPIFVSICMHKVLCEKVASKSDYQLSQVGMMPFGVMFTQFLKYLMLLFKFFLFSYFKDTIYLFIYLVCLCEWGSGQRKRKRISNRPHTEHRA